MNNTGKLKTGMFVMSAAILAAALLVGGVGLKESLAQDSVSVRPSMAATPVAQAEAQATAKSVADGYGFLAIALSVGLACLGAGLAVGRVGSAALGAIVEKPEFMGRALIFVGLAEGIAIYGLIFGILLLRQL